MLELEHGFRVVDANARLEPDAARRPSGGAGDPERLEREMHQAGIVRSAVYPTYRDGSYLKADNGVALRSVDLPLVPLALGKNVRSLRIRVMGLGGAVAGLAGALYAHFNAFIDPTYFLPLETFIVWSMIILGGAGNHIGALVGALIVEAIYNSTRFISDYVPIGDNVLGSLRMIAIGVLIIMVIIYLPKGLVPEPLRRYTGRRGTPAKERGHVRDRTA
jgi:ABC-type uncharacterized transport system permease subunit